VTAAGPYVHGDPPSIGTGSFPLTLDSAASVDPDSPCPTDVNHCHDAVVTPAVVSPGIVAWVWRLVDVSPELELTYPPGRVDETFGIDGTSPTLVFNVGDLLPGHLDIA